MTDTMKTNLLPEEIVGGAAYELYDGSIITVSGVFDGLCSYFDGNHGFAFYPVEEVAAKAVRRVEMPLIIPQEEADRRERAPLARDMTLEERAQMERETLELHARCEEFLKDRVPRFKPCTHMLLAFDPQGEPVAIAKYDEADAEKVVLRWLREGRTVQKLPRKEALALFLG